MKGRAKVLDPFKDNLFRRELDPVTGEKFLEKSCPKCSKKAGTTVFYPESAFGELVAANGQVKPQRDCQLHRKRQAVPKPPAVESIPAEDKTLV